MAEDNNDDANCDAANDGWWWSMIFNMLIDIWLFNMLIDIWPAI